MTYICILTLISTYINTHTRIYIYIYTYMHTHNTYIHMYVVTYTYAFTKYAHKIISLPSCLYVKYIEFRALGIYDIPKRLIRKLCIKRPHTHARIHAHMLTHNILHMKFEYEAFISFVHVDPCDCVTCCSSYGHFALNFCVD
jgi:hypothetical protein